MLWQILFVIGVLCQCISINSGGNPWLTKAAWLLWAIAAILWLVAPEAGFSTAHHPLLRF